MENTVFGLNWRLLMFVLLMASFVEKSKQEDSPSPTPETTTTVAVTNSTTNTNTTDTSSVATSKNGNSGVDVTATDKTSSTIRPITNAPGVTQAQTGANTKGRPVTDSCWDAYYNCTQTNGKDDFAGAQYCVAYDKAKNCITTSKGCTADDTSRLYFLDCEPVATFDKVNITSTMVDVLCQGRITECLSGTAIKDSITTYTNFTSFFCKYKDKSCLTKKEMKAVCSEAQYDAAFKIADCSSADALLFSSVIIILAILPQIWLKTY